MRATLRDIGASRANGLPEGQGSINGRSGQLGKYRLVCIALAVLIVGMMIGVLSSRTRCTAASPQLDELDQMAAQGRSDLVVGLADLQLGSPTLCPATRLAVATLRYRSAMDELYRTGETSGAGGLSAPLQWQEIERRAVADRVSVDPPMVVAGDAYRAGEWDLSRVAFIKGFAQLADRSMVPLYYAATRNWGNALIAGSGNGNSAQGLTALRTACEIALAYELSQQEACQDLQSKLASDSWPPPSPDDAVLLAARS